MLPAFFLLLGSAAYQPMESTIEREWLIGMTTKPKMGLMISFTMWRRSGISIEMNSSIVRSRNENEAELAELRSNLLKHPTDLKAQHRLAVLLGIMEQKQASQKEFDRLIQQQREIIKTNPTDANSTIDLCRYLESADQLIDWGKECELGLQRFPNQIQLLEQKLAWELDRTWKELIEGIVTAAELERLDTQLVQLFQSKLKPAPANITRAQERLKQAQQTVGLLEKHGNPIAVSKAKLLFGFMNHRIETVLTFMSKPETDPAKISLLYMQLTYLPTKEYLPELKSLAEMDPENHVTHFALMMSEIAYSAFDSKNLPGVRECLKCMDLAYFKSHNYLDQQKQLLLWANDLSKPQRSLECLLILASLYMMSGGDLTTLQPLLESHTKTSPKREELWVFLGLIIYQVVDRKQVEEFPKWRERLSAWETESLKHLDTIRLRMSWSGCWRCLKDLERAEAILRKGFLLDPESVDLATAMGITILETREPERIPEVVQMFNRARLSLPSANTHENWKMVHENAMIMMAIEGRYKDLIQGSMSFDWYKVPSEKVELLKEWSIRKQPDVWTTMFQLPVLFHRQSQPTVIPAASFEIKQTELEKQPNPNPLNFMKQPRPITPMPR
jgi:tetratricopeptide (TPR) repeat protein